MKKLLAILLLLSIPASAANTTPPGINDQVLYNKMGKQGALALSGIFIVDCPSGQSYLSLTTTVSCPSMAGNIVTPLNVPWVTPLGDNIVTP